MLVVWALGAAVAVASPPEPTIYDTGWRSGDAPPATGPVAIGPVDTLFSGFTETVVYAIGDASVVVTWAGPSRDAATAGVVLPVTPDTTRDDLVSLSLDAVEALDRWTRPWLWEETCGQVLEAPASGCGGSSANAGRADRSDEAGCGSSGSSGGCSFNLGDSAGLQDSGQGRDTGGAGQSFALGDYRAWLPTPETGAAFAAWLDGRGFSQPPGLLEASEGWIALGGSFLVLRLDAEAVDSEAPLPAVQALIRGTSPPLPVGMGSLGGDDARDLVVHTLHASEARVPALPLAGPWDCLLDAGSRNATTVGDALAEDWHAATGIFPGSEEASGAQPAWSPESWLPEGQCMDCQGTDFLSESVLSMLGHDDISVAIHRSRIRFDRRAVPGPVALEVPAEESPRGTKRVVESRWELTGLLPACDGSEIQGGGTCFSAAWWAERALNVHDEREELSLDERRCGRGRGAVVLALPFVLAGFRRRR